MPGSRKNYSVRIQVESISLTRPDATTVDSEATTFTSWWWEDTLPLRQPERLWVCNFESLYTLRATDPVKGTFGPLVVPELEHENQCF